MTEHSIRFGILGCGAISHTHAEAIALQSNAVLAGVADVSPALAENFAKKYSTRAYPTPEAMLADETVDAVCICTPSGLHAEHARMALEAKKHVVLEKPMAFTKAQAEELALTADRCGRVLTVISQLRFSDDIRRLKELMAKNAFGRPVLCDLYMKYWRDPGYYSQSAWKGTRRFDGGGALMNQGIHGVDLLLYLAGNAKVLFARNRTVFHSIEVEDCSVAMLEFENGATGVIEASTCACPGFARRLEIVGTEGSVVLTEDRIEKLVLGGKTLVDGASVPPPGTASNPMALSCQLHARQLTNFVRAILAGEPLVMTAADGARAVALIEDVYSFA